MLQKQQNQLLHFPQALITARIEAGAKVCGTNTRRSDPQSLRVNSMKCDNEPGRWAKSEHQLTLR